MRKCLAILPDVKRFEKILKLQTKYNNVVSAGTNYEENMDLYVSILISVLGSKG